MNSYQLKNLLLSKIRDYIGTYKKGSNIDIAVSIGTSPSNVSKTGVELIIPKCPDSSQKIGQIITQNWTVDLIEHSRSGDILPDILHILVCNFPCKTRYFGYDLPTVFNHAEVTFHNLSL